MFVELCAVFVAGLPTNFVTFLPAVLMVGVFYLLLFRPNQKKQKLWQEMLNNLKKSRNLTMLLTTHYMEEADRLCDRIAIVDHGTLVALGTPIELK